MRGVYVCLVVFLQTYTTGLRARKLEHGTVRVGVQIKVCETEHGGHFSDEYSVSTYFEASIHASFNGEYAKKPRRKLLHFFF